MRSVFLLLILALVVHDSIGLSLDPGKNTVKNAYCCCFVNENKKATKSHLAKSRNACGAIFTHSNSPHRIVFIFICWLFSLKFYFSSRGMIRKKTYKILHTKKKQHKLVRETPSRRRGNYVSGEIKKLASE